MLEGHFLFLRSECVMFFLLFVFVITPLVRFFVAVVCSSGLLPLRGQLLQWSISPCGKMLHWSFTPFGQFLQWSFTLCGNFFQWFLPSAS